MLQKTLAFTSIILFSFLGGFVAQILLTSTPSEAASKFLSYFNIKDASNPKGIEFYVHQGAPAQNFYAQDGKIRLQMGIYTEQGERGLPLLTLNDNSGNIRMLLRLAGPNESPVLIMKDKQHRDRMVMGLGLAGNENPFLTVYDDAGQKTNIFGSF